MQIDVCEFKSVFLLCARLTQLYISVDLHPSFCIFFQFSVIHPYLLRFCHYYYMYITYNIIFYINIFALCHSWNLFDIVQQMQIVHILYTCRSKWSLFWCWRDDRVIVHCSHTQYFQKPHRVNIFVLNYFYAYVIVRTVLEAYFRVVH